jgi:UDP-glucose 4-epimerase
MRVLVAGGASYIDSHITLALLQAGYDLVVLDNFSNSSCHSLKRVAKIAEREAVLTKGDVCDSALFDRLLSEHSVDAVFHFAGLKAVAESVSQSVRYYDNNVLGSLVLLKASSLKYS